MARGRVALVLAALAACRGERSRDASGASGDADDSPAARLEAARRGVVVRAIDECGASLQEGDLEAAADRLARLRVNGVPPDLRPALAGLESLLEGRRWE